MAVAIGGNPSNDEKRCLLVRISQDPLLYGKYMNGGTERFELSGDAGVRVFM